MQLKKLSKSVNFYKSLASDYVAHEPRRPTRPELIPVAVA